MARPLRIEFAGAWYHVMNRGAGGRVIYPNDLLRRAFLELLDEIRERYAVETHAWCLMGNHYHLICRTQQANLGRAMRHLDGVYTQRHNRLCRTDGPLFRGRYKAIIVDSDAYLAQLSRYVHCNPVDAQLVERAQDWRWSSYRCYIGESSRPNWLHTEDILNMFGRRDVRRRYRVYVDRGVDAELTAFYAKTAISPVLGSRDFREAVQIQASRVDKTEVPDSRRIRQRPHIATIVAMTAATFEVTPEDILKPTPGRPNLARALAMRLCQSPGGYSLKTIAQAFGFQSYTAVSTAVCRLRDRQLEPELEAKISDLKHRLFGAE